MDFYINFVLFGVKVTTISRLFTLRRFTWCSVNNVHQIDLMVRSHLTEKRSTKWRAPPIRRVNQPSSFSAANHPLYANLIHSQCESHTFAVSRVARRTAFDDWHLPRKLIWNSIISFTLVSNTISSGPLNETFSLMLSLMIKLWPSVEQKSGYRMRFYC